MRPKGIPAEIRTQKKPKQQEKGPSKHETKMKFIKAVERKINAQLLKIMRDCAMKNQPLPTQNAIAKQLNVERSRIPRSIYALIRDGSIIKKGEPGHRTFLVTKVGMTTGNPNPPIDRSSDGPREPSDPPRLKWLDSADTLLKSLKDNDAATAERMKLRRNEMGLDIEPEVVECT